MAKPRFTRTIVEAGEHRIELFKKAHNAMATANDMYAELIANNPNDETIVGCCKTVIKDSAALMFYLGTKAPVTVSKPEATAPDPTPPASDNTAETREPVEA